MEQLSIHHCCIICYKDCDCCGNKSDGFQNEFPSKAKVLSQFFQLLERHLSNSKKENEQFSLLFQIFKTNSELLHSCTDCFRILKSFCDLYHELERTKLLLNWRLDTLTSIMGFARRVKSRRNNFKRSLEQVTQIGRKSLAGSEDHQSVSAELETIFEIKKYLEDLCSSKVSGAALKVRLERLPRRSLASSSSIYVASSVGDSEIGSGVSSSEKNDDGNSTPLHLPEEGSTTKYVIGPVLGPDPPENSYLSMHKVTERPEVLGPRPDPTLVSIDEAETPLGLPFPIKVNSPPKNPVQVLDHEPNEIPQINLGSRSKTKLELCSVKLSAAAPTVKLERSPRRHGVPGSPDNTVSQLANFESEAGAPSQEINGDGDGTCPPPHFLEENTTENPEEPELENGSSSTSTNSEQPEVLESLPNHNLVSKSIGATESPAVLPINENSALENPVEVFEHDLEEIPQIEFSSPSKPKLELNEALDQLPTSKLDEIQESSLDLEPENEVRSEEDDDDDYFYPNGVETDDSSTTDTSDDDYDNDDKDYEPPSVGPATRSRSLRQDKQLENGKKKKNNMTGNGQNKKTYFCGTSTHSKKKNEQIRLPPPSPPTFTTKRKLKTCQKCGKGFPNKTQLKEHATKVHRGKEGEITCSLCWKPCHSSSDFRSHTELEHSNMFRHPDTCRDRFRFQCPDPRCSKLFLKLPSLLKHWKEKNPETEGRTISVKILFSGQEYAKVEVPTGLFFCEVKGCTWEPLVSQEDLREHSKLHGEFHCKFCPRVETFAPDLAIHEMDLHGTKINKKETKCPRCPAKFKMEATKLPFYFRSHFFQEHLELSPGSAVNYSCGICKTFESGSKNPASVFRHIGAQHDTNPPENQIVRCGLKVTGNETCTAYFLGKRGHGFHHNMWHKREPMLNRKRETFECEFCFKSFFRSDHLRKHRQQVHNVQFVVECKHPGCDNKFETEKDAEGHFQLQHQTRYMDKPEAARKCPDCDRTFWNKGNLTAHIRFKHNSTPEPKPRKRFICETCGKGFAEKCQLHIHKLSHSGPESWQFVCETCGKRCLNNGKLQEHKRTHGKEKPFVCQICKQAYAHRHNLRIHVNSKHGDQVKDIPKKYDRSNSTSKKGTKRKRKHDEEDGDSDEDE